MVLLVTHPTSWTNAKSRAPKLATSRLLPNRRVRDDESKIVIGAVLRKGSVDWKRTSERMIGEAAAATLTVKGTGKAASGAQDGKLCRAITVGRIVTKSNRFTNGEGAVVTVATPSSSHADTAQHMRITIADGICDLIHASSDRLAIRAPTSEPAGSYYKASKMTRRSQVPPEVEEYRDERWCREGTRQIDTAFQAERFVEQVGFSACLADSRRPGPSLYVAVCGRRDAVMPRHVQKDPEASLTWQLKDELVRRGNVYYGKLARGKATFIAPRMVPYFHAIWGIRRSQEQQRLSSNARKVLRVLRSEWEMATSDLRDESGVRDRASFTRALDELQAAMIVIPSAVFYQPKLTYIWTLGIGRFPQLLLRRVNRDSALREIARSFLASACMTVPGELARVTGLSRPDAGRGNRALVAEGYATMLAPGVYQRAR